MSKTIKPLTNEQLQAKAPSLFQDQPYHAVSSKYHFIETIEIVEQLRNESWFPVSVNEAGVKNLDKDGFQQHYVRFQHFSDLINPNANVVELLLFNSHDRSKAFTISAGIYRYVGILHSAVEIHLCQDFLLQLHLHSHINVFKIWETF